MELEQAKKERNKLTGTAMEDKELSLRENIHNIVESWKSTSEFGTTNNILVMNLMEAFRRSTVDLIAQAREEEGKAVAEEIRNNIQKQVSGIVIKPKEDSGIDIELMKIMEKVLKKSYEYPVDEALASRYGREEGENGTKN